MSFPSLVSVRVRGRRGCKRRPRGINALLLDLNDGCQTSRVVRPTYDLV